MRVSKKSKILALALSLTMLMCAMPMMAMAEETPAPSLVEIQAVAILQDPTDDELLDVTVLYDVDDSVGAQMTLLATTTSYNVDIVEGTGEVTNIAYIDQIAKPEADAEGFRSFTFKVVKANLGADNRLYVKVGGSDITTPAILDEEFDGDEPTILYGDVNGDGLVTPADAAFVLQRYAEIIDKFPVGSDINGDVNGDGLVTPADAAFILQKYAEIIDVFPIEVKN